MRQQAEIGADHYSFSVCIVRPFFGEQPLGHATGFLWQFGKLLYLITNWHVVTGRNSNTFEFEDKKRAAEPDNLRFKYRRENRDNSDVIVPLLNDGMPTWLVHPEWGPAVDVVAIPIQGEEPSRCMYPINMLPETPLVMRITDRLSIIGYPFDGHDLPIWKQASVATEPDLATQGKRHMLVDSLSRPGMSGSPVLHRAAFRAEVETTPIDADHPEEGMYTEVKDIGTPATRFIGVYSGRLHTHSDLDAQLGVVWPRHHVEEIVEFGVADKPPVLRLSEKRAAEEGAAVT